MSNKLLSFDVDSVLLDTEEVIFERINAVYNRVINAKDVTHWTFYMENFPSILEYFGNPELYEKVKPIYEMIEVMREVIEIYGANNIQLITSSHSDMKEAKEAALRRFYGHLKDWEKIDIIHVGLKDEDMGEGLESNISHHKHVFSENSILIDDAIHNIEDHLNHNHYNEAILVDFGYGWNQNFTHSRAIRAKSAGSILDIIKRKLPR